MEIKIKGESDSKMVVSVTHDSLIKIEITSYRTSKEYTKGMIITPEELRAVMASIEALL